MFLEDAGTPEKSYDRLVWVDAAIDIRSVTSVRLIRAPLSGNELIQANVLWICITSRAAFSGWSVVRAIPETTRVML